MQSFAKAAAKPKPKKEPVKQEPALSDDGEADDDDNIPTVQTSPRAVEARRQAQKKRTESLKRMMEEESDEDADKKDDEDEDEEMEEAPEPEEEPEPEPEPEAKKVNEGPSEIVSSTDGGRRRGRRRVMQKKRILDDEGFMGMSMSPDLSIGFRLTSSSHDTGARMGVLLRGRSTAPCQEAYSGPNTCIVGVGAEAQEACCENWPGQHHVILCEEVMIS